MNKWNNEWINEIMNERKNEWKINECISVRVWEKWCVELLKRVVDAGRVWVCFQDMCRLNKLPSDAYIVTKNFEDWHGRHDHWPALEGGKKRTREWVRCSALITQGRTDTHMHCTSSGEAAGWVQGEYLKHYFCVWRVELERCRELAEVQLVAGGVPQQCAARLILRMMKGH